MWRVVDGGSPCLQGFYTLSNGRVAAADELLN